MGVPPKFYGSKLSGVSPVISYSVTICVDYNKYIYTHYAFVGLVGRTQIKPVVLMYEYYISLIIIP